MNRDSVLISLTHFCDKHGPRIICVTQCGSNQNSNDDDDNTNDFNPTNINSNIGDELLVPNYPIDSYCESCLLQFPSRSETIPSNPDDKTDHRDNNDDIRSMRTILGENVFVTTQYSSIRFQKLNSITRKVFSEETMIYDSSPFIFYDDNRGLNLSMGFKLYDENARGNERRYCLILTIDQSNIEMAMNILSQNWNFVILGFKKIINYIKSLHSEVLNGISNNCDNIYNINNHGHNHNPAVMKNNVNVKDISSISRLSLKSNDSGPFIGNYLRANKTKIAKNLIELTNNKSIFIKLHKWNAYLISSLIDCDKHYTNED